MELPAGKTNLTFLGDSVESKVLPYGFATRDAGFAVKYQTLRMEKGELVVETFTIFKDKSGRSNYRSEERFKKKQARPNDS